MGAAYGFVSSIGIFLALKSFSIVKKRSNGSSSVEALCSLHELLSRKVIGVDSQTVEIVHSFNAGMSVTHAVFSADGSRLIPSGAIKQSGDANKKFGPVNIYTVIER